MPTPTAPHKTPGHTPPTLESKGGLWVGRFQAMASPCEVLLEGVDLHEDTAAALVDSAAQEAWRIEQKFSRYRADNIIAKIHAEAGVPITVDDETADLLDYADHCYQLSHGKFDISSGILRKVWQFRGAEFSPDPAELEAILTRVGWDKCRWKRPQLTLPAHAEIDLGGIGKEYAVDRTLKLLSNTSAGSPILLNFGGDIACSGPRSNGKPWNIGLEKTAASAEPAEPPLIALYQGGIATSGDTHRFTLHKGERLSHILDPHTGWPVCGAPHTVTVLADSCTLAGMLATFAMLQGANAEVFLAEQGFPYWIQRA